MGLYLALVRAQVSAQWRYRGSFVVQAVGQFLATFTDFVMLLLLLFQQFPSIAGWTLGEVALLARDGRAGVRHLGPALRRVRRPQQDDPPGDVRPRC